MRDIDKNLFQLAASKKNENVKIQQLINQGANLKQKDMNGKTPFEVALNAQNGDNAFLLLQNMLASQIDLQQLYKDRNILNEIIMTSSFATNENKDKLINIIDKLLINKIDVNLPDRNSISPLSQAMTCNNSNLAAKLIKYGAIDETAIIKTHDVKSKRIFEITQKTVNNMFEAAKSGDIEAIKAHHEKYDIPLTIKDKDGKSLLEHALENHHFKLAKLLSPQYEYKDLDFLTKNSSRNTIFAQKVLKEREEYGSKRPRKRKIYDISKPPSTELDDLTFLAKRPASPLELPCEESGHDLSFLAKSPPRSQSIGF